MARVQVEEHQSEPLHVKYRPRTLQDFAGNNAAVRSLANAMLAKALPHSYLFTGPSGCGKTTLARIVAAGLGVLAENVLEIDAATNSGIDAMKAVTDTLKYKGFGASSRKFVIIDECHALSKSAWQSLLKVVEEPPEHVFFALCTTEQGKVPETIQTRCLRYSVTSLAKDDLWDLIEHVCKKEKIPMPADAIVQQILRVADGSPRKALTALAMVHDCESEAEAAAVLSQPLESHDVIELCRALVSKAVKWEQVTKVLESVKDEDPEGLRLIIVNYISAVLMKSTKEAHTLHLLDVLSQFMRPTNRSEKMGPLLLAFGNIVFPPR